MLPLPALRLEATRQLELTELERKERRRAE